MISRIFVLCTLALVALLATSSSYAGQGAPALTPGLTPAAALAQHQAYLDQEAARAARAELDRRYRAGEMTPSERKDYEALVERERREEQARARAAAAAAARAAYVRNTRRTGGGPSGGK